MKVRIGNDICLHVTLLGKHDDINIKSIHAYLINMTHEEHMEEEKRTVRYVGRFPVEPCSHGYRGTPYDLCHSGHPTFHVLPLCVPAPYCGFGVWPHSFDAFHGHYRGHLDPHPRFFDPHDNHLWGWGAPDDPHFDGPGRVGDHWECQFADKFRAPVKSTPYKNKVLVYFPAEDQHYTGVYKLVIVAKIYEPGYAPNDLRTVTMDYREIFTIVGSSDEADVDGAVELSIGNTKSVTGINISGSQTISVGQTGKLIASVVPVDVDENGVVWSIVEGGEYVSIVTSTDTSCTILGLSCPEGKSYVQATLRATSKKTPSVYTDIPITISKDKVIDIYTQAGEFRSNGSVGNDRKEYINLTLTDGSNVQIDTTKETVWYEGN